MRYLKYWLRSVNSFNSDLLDNGTLSEVICYGFYDFNNSSGENISRLKHSKG